MDDALRAYKASAAIEAVTPLIKKFGASGTTDYSVMQSAISAELKNKNVNDEIYQLMRVAMKDESLSVASTKESFSSLAAKRIQKENQKKKDEKKEKEEIDNNPIAGKSFKVNMDELKDKSKNQIKEKDQIKEIVIKKLHEAGFSDEQINKPVKHATINGVTFDVSPPKSAGDFATDMLYQLARGMSAEEIAQKQQEEKNSQEQTSAEQQQEEPEPYTSEVEKEKKEEQEENETQQENDENKKENTQTKDDDALSQEELDEISYYGFENITSHSEFENFKNDDFYKKTVETYGRAYAPSDNKTTS